MKVYYNSLNEPYSSSHETTKTSQRSTLQLANIWTRCPTQRLSLDSYSDAVLDRNKTCSHKENMWSINYPLVLLTISILSFFHRKKMHHPIQEQQGFQGKPTMHTLTPAHSQWHTPYSHAHIPMYSTSHFYTQSLTLLHTLVSSLRSFMKGMNWSRYRLGVPETWLR